MLEEYIDKFFLKAVTNSSFMLVYLVFPEITSMIHINQKKEGKNTFLVLIV